MPSPRYFFRLQQHQADALEALATRLETTPGLIAKLIVVRTLSEVATVLEDHDTQLEIIRFNMLQIAAVHRDLIRADKLPDDDLSKATLESIERIAQSVDQIRDRAFARPSTTVQEIIREFDAGPSQPSLPLTR